MNCHFLWSWHFQRPPGWDWPAGAVSLAPPSGDIDIKKQHETLGGCGMWGLMEVDDVCINNDVTLREKNKETPYKTQSTA